MPKTRDMWISQKNYRSILHQIDVLKKAVSNDGAVIRELHKIILELMRCSRPPPATRLVLESLIINGQFKSTTMPITLNTPTDWAVLTLKAVADDGQGTVKDSEIKAGSLVSYLLSDPSLGTLKVDPNNTLRVLFVGLATGAGGKTTLSAKGLNDAGSEINFTDSINVPGTNPPPPPLATGFTGTWDGPHPATDPLPF